MSTITLNPVEKAALEDLRREWDSDKSLESLASQLFTGALVRCARDIEVILIRNDIDPAEKIPGLLYAAELEKIGIPVPDPKPTFRQDLLRRLRHPVLQGYLFGLATCAAAILLTAALQVV